MKKNLTRREDGSYVLKHKTKKVKKGNCIECGQNEKNRRLGLFWSARWNSLNANQ